MEIRKLKLGEEPPMDLLLLADPSASIVLGYLQRGECYLAEMNGHLAAAYVILPTRPETIELVNIAVAEDQQGKGIGKQLILHAIEQAKALGFSTMEVGTGNSSIGQLALYQKCGFRIVSVDRDFFIRHYAEDIVENGIACRDMIRLAQDL
ncbi:GNAT family N-acetyltransferase [Paenibacillus alba]|uniref:GNAT family N-acetyltransferase n=1 Tax=Paenibacillus alba TaxID=1197127 RepID=A0ABU6GDK4_9BACL|nr:GNAT family N-acetyltransferase [Paenibacillus alba]MEC0230769.1 GNAT family N-acetyltransferase [Paenibacillus alba]NQX65160.1 GNAT family N-acetyltransferase [Paenibacillus alba]